MKKFDILRKRRRTFVDNNIVSTDEGRLSYRGIVWAQPRQTSSGSDQKGGWHRRLYIRVDCWPTKIRSGIRTKDDLHGVGEHVLGGAGPRGFLRVPKIYRLQNWDVVPSGLIGRSQAGVLSHLHGSFKNSDPFGVLC